MDKKIEILICVLIATTLILASVVFETPVFETPQSNNIPGPKATMILSAYPTADSYGQGIDRIYVLVNGYYNKTAYDYQGPWNNTIEVAPEDNVTLTVYVWMNSTLTGSATIQEHLNAVKLHISVKAGNGTEVFAKQNFTYHGPMAAMGAMVNIHYDVYLDFVPTVGDIYTGTITYEVYY